MSEEKKKTAKKARTLVFQDKFYSDIDLPNMLYARIIRSPIEQGTLKSFPPLSTDTCRLYTAHDIPGSHFLQTLHGTVPIFCEGPIAYKGEPLGILVGSDEQELARLAQDIQKRLLEDSAEYIASDTQEQEAPTKEVIERIVTHGPCFGAHEDATISGLQSVFDQAQTVVDNTWTYALSTAYYRECNGALCSFDGDILTVYTASQWFSNLRRLLCQALSLTTDAITINKTRSYNRSTTSIWYNAIIACQVAVAAFHEKKPVKLVYSRQEQDAYINNPLSVAIHHRTALSSEGTLLAMQIDLDLDVGNHAVFAKEILDRLVIASCGIYKAENVSIDARVHQSQQPPFSVDLALIDAAAFFAVENQMNALSHASQFTPLELRSLNLSAPVEPDRPLEMPFGFHLTKPMETFENLAAASNFNRKYVAYKLNSQARNIPTDKEYRASPYLAPIRGIGFACAFEGSCYYGSEPYGNDQSLELTLEENGGITIHCPPLSATIQEIWKNKAADIVGIKPSAIKMDSHFESENEPLLPESVYANSSVMLTLLKRCCEAIKKRKEDTELPLTVKRRLTPEQKKEWDAQQFTGYPFYSSAFIAASVEVELDSSTYRETIRDIFIQISAGEIAKKEVAEYAVKLGVQKVLSSLVQNDTLDVAPDAIHIAFTPSDETPVHIGELVQRAVPAAYTAALSQALGRNVTQIPLHSDSLYHLLKTEVAADANISDAQ